MFAGVGLERGGRARNFDGLGDGAYGHREIHALAGVYADRHVRGRSLGEALVFYGNRIAAHPDVEEIVAAIVGSAGLSLNPGVQVGERDVGFGDTRPRRVAHRAQNLGGVELSV